MSNKTSVNLNQKPDLILKRVIESISNATNSTLEFAKKNALETLHAAITSSNKKKSWHKDYENIMKFHMELCVHFKDNITAKDGLHQYRNVCSSVDITHIVPIIYHLLDLAEAKLVEAKNKADKNNLAAVAARSNDFNHDKYAETILLSTITDDNSEDVNTREIVTPWIRFLIENYRSILDILSKHIELEKVYHAVFERAFKFCLEYGRKREFKTFCDILRTHHLNSAKNLAPKKGAKIDVAHDSTDLQLQTRFSQLEVSTSMELWKESFEIIKDINNITALSKKTPKTKFMIQYFEKLIKIYWVAENKLLHAYSWLKLYNLFSESKKEFKAGEKSLMASNVLLAALSALPTNFDLYATAKSELDEELSENEPVEAKKTLNLIDFQAAPSRQALLNEIISSNILKEVYPELNSLYSILETSNTSSLKIVKSILPALEVIKAQPSLKQYLAPLHKIVVIKLIQQLSKIYSTVKMNFVYKLLSDIHELTPVEIEKIILDAIVNKHLQLKVDHSTGTFNFQSASDISSIDVQTSQFANSLNKINNIIKKFQTNEVEERRVIFKQLVKDANEDFENVTQKFKVLIAERLQLLDEEYENKQRQELEEKQRQEEEERAREAEKEKERQDRERNEKSKKELLEKEISETRSNLRKYGINKSEEELAALSSDERKKLLEDAKAEANKAKSQEEKKILEFARNTRTIARAQRIEVANHLNRLLDAYAEEDQKHRDACYNAFKENYVAEFKLKPYRLIHDKPIIAKLYEKYIENQHSYYNKTIQDIRNKAVEAARKEAKEAELEAKREEERRIEAENNRKRLEEEAKALEEKKRKKESEYNKVRENIENDKEEVWQRGVAPQRTGRGDRDFGRSDSLRGDREFSRGDSLRGEREFTRGDSIRGDREFTRGDSLRGDREFTRGDSIRGERGSGRDFGRSDSLRGDREFTRGEFFRGDRDRERERERDRDFVRGEALRERKSVSDEKDNWRDRSDPKTEEADGWQQISRKSSKSAPSEDNWRSKRDSKDDKSSKKKDSFRGKN